MGWSQYRNGLGGVTTHMGVTAYKIQKPGHYPEGSAQHSEQDESLKSKIKFYISEGNNLT
jgi:hypothetical protein